LLVLLLALLIGGLARLRGAAALLLLLARLLVLVAHLPAALVFGRSALLLALVGLLLMLLVLTRLTGLRLARLLVLSHYYLHQGGDGAAREIAQRPCHAVLAVRCMAGVTFSTPSRHLLPPRFTTSAPIYTPHRHRPPLHCPP